MIHVNVNYKTCKAKYSPMNHVFYGRNKWVKKLGENNNTKQLNYLLFLLNIKSCPFHLKLQSR